MVRLVGNWRSSAFTFKPLKLDKESSSVDRIQPAEEFATLPFLLYYCHHHCCGHHLGSSSWNLFSDTYMVNSFPSFKAPDKYYLFRTFPHSLGPSSSLLSQQFLRPSVPAKSTFVLQRCLPCWIVSSSRSGLVLLPIFQVPWGQETLFIGCLLCPWWLRQ